MGAIMVTKKGGTVAGVVSNFALVRAVGCLTPGEKNTWTLANATEPVVTRDESPGPTDLTDAARQPLGSLRFRLLSVLSSHNVDALKGQKVEARGLVFRRQGDDRLNLTSPRTAGSSSEPGR